MKKKNRTWIIVVVVLALLVLAVIRWGIRTYNGFISQEEFSWRRHLLSWEFSSRSYRFDSF